MPHVVVVGAGVTGLVTARLLASRAIDVTVLEASSRVGGAVRTDRIAGRHVDVGAEAFHTSSPEPLQLVTALRLEPELVEAEPHEPTWIAWDGGLRALPAGVGPAGPTRVAPLLASRLLSPLGLGRAALEPLVPRRADVADLAVGEAVRRRFGRQVRDRVVGPLLGGLHAGDVGRLSLEHTAPQLAATLARGESVLLAGQRARRGRARSDGPAFVTLRGGLSRIVDRMAAELPTPVRTGEAVERVVPDGHRYRVRTDAGDEVVADAVVLAVPAAAAAAILPGDVATAIAALGRLRAADVAVAVLRYPGVNSEQVPALRATGLLVPQGTARLLKAATFLSTKWPHLAGDDGFLIRASAGRVGEDAINALDDTALACRLHEDLADLTGLDVDPDLAHVVRWPAAMPQLEVGHGRHLDAVRAALAQLPPIELAGAPYDGIGIASCLRAAPRTAERLMGRLREVVG